MSKLLLKMMGLIVLLSSFNMFKTNDCCFLPQEIIDSGDLLLCTQYLGSIPGCSYPICGSCMNSNLMFSADPSCEFPC